jgi:hypothetical protein
MSRLLHTSTIVLQSVVTQRSNVVLAATLAGLEQPRRDFGAQLDFGRGARLIGTCRRWYELR